MDQLIMPGTVVLCLDDSEAEDLVREGHYYEVEATSHQGLMLRLVDVAEPLSVDRFEVVSFGASGHRNAFVSMEASCR